MKYIVKSTGVFAYILFILLSWAIGFEPGKEIGGNFISFSMTMLKILPSAFILIGLFEVWVRQETVERHLGEDSGVKGYLWAVLLSGTTIGGVYVALPVAYSLHNKGARLSVIFTYIGASAICKIPMAIFETSFLGLKFTLIRLCVSIPLVILSSILLGNYLAGRNYSLMEGK